MAWLPDLNEPEANFEEPIILNTLAIVERDFKEALDYYFLDSPTYLTRYGEANSVGPDGNDYDDFAERELGQLVRNEFPHFVVGPRSTPTAGAADNSCIIETPRISSYIGVIGNSAADVTRKIMRYVKVFNSVIRSARNELREGLSNGFGLVIESIEHEYGPIGDKESIYYRSAYVEITLSLRER